MKKYTEIFKRSVISNLGDLKEKGSIDINGLRIKNVRELCHFLDISTNTLYRWVKDFSFLKSQKKDVSDETIPLRYECYAEHWCKAYQSESDEVNENCNMLGNCEGFKPLDDVAKDLIFKDKMAKAYENGGDIHESESDLISNEATSDDFDDIHYEKETRIAEKVYDAVNMNFFELQDKKKVPGRKSKGIFNQRYYGWFAGMLGIKGYSNMLVPQLKVAIGNELIRQSGLIDMNKASEKLSKNAINYIEKHGRL